jgi:hypothetical protein
MNLRKRTSLMIIEGRNTLGTCTRSFIPDTNTEEDNFSYTPMITGVSKWIAGSRYNLMRASRSIQDADLKRQNSEVGTLGSID